jgi:hypothetical protein
MSKISISVAMAPNNSERLRQGKLDSLARSALLIFRYLRPLASGDGLYAVPACSKTNVLKQHCRPVVPNSVVLYD